MSIIGINTSRVTSTRWRNLCAVLLAAMAGTAISATRTEVEVMALTQTTCEAFRTRDIPTLERLLADDFVLVSSNSQVQSRAQTLAEVHADEPKYHVFRNHDMTARIYGDAAVVQGITSLEGLSAGKPFTLDVRFTDTLIRRHGQWRIVVSHVTRIPAP
ncbi:MAG: nuclear transport factor 2 family protein [Tahibacter sp.]